MIRFPVHINVSRRTPAGLEPFGRIELPSPGVYAIGRVPNDNHIHLDSRNVSRHHAWLEARVDGFTAVNRSTTNPALIGDQEIDRAAWDGATPLILGDCLLVVAGTEGTVVLDPSAPAGGPVPGATMVLPSRPDEPEVTRIAAPTPILKIDVPSGSELAPGQAEMAFPGQLFAGEIVSIQAIHASGFYAGESEFLTLGGGIGSFVWVDYLRCYGVPAEAIRVIGLEPIPYANYRRLTRNSQIPNHERLRSNSISAPDNIWGFPGYASREAFRGMLRADFSSLFHVLTVFAEPILPSYTPRIGDVFRAMDREAARIGWRQMMTPGRVIAMRKTDDGRYAVAYRVAEEDAGGGPRGRIFIARYVHIATGYPATRFTDDLQDFKRQHPGDTRVVAAYEPHDDLYTRLVQARRPQLVVIRGRGIVASRILQRLYEIRAENPQIQVLHLMRTPVPDNGGSVWKKARRPVFNHTELQGFNWPKASWGGILRIEMERADPEKRSRMYQALGGTTTAWRWDWIRIQREGLAEGWYQVRFGNITQIGYPNGTDTSRIAMSVLPPGAQQPFPLVADAVIDCTGLIGDVNNSPFLRDLCATYRLQRNLSPGTGPERKMTGITVTNDYEIPGMRHGYGHVYAAGTITANGPYCGVDSFLGLQYVALRSVDHLHTVGAPGVSSFGPLQSAGQWLKWCVGSPP